MDLLLPSNGENQKEFKKSILRKLALYSTEILKLKKILGAKNPYLYQCEEKLKTLVPACSQIQYDIHNFYLPQIQICLQKVFQQTNLLEYIFKFLLEREEIKIKYRMNKELRKRFLSKCDLLWPPKWQVFQSPISYQIESLSSSQEIATSHLYCAEIEILLTRNHQRRKSKQHQHQFRKYQLEGAMHPNYPNVKSENKQEKGKKEEKQEREEGRDEKQEEEEEDKEEEEEEEEQDVAVLGLTCNDKYFALLYHTEFQQNCYHEKKQGNWLIESRFSNSHQLTPIATINFRNLFEKRNLLSQTNEFKCSNILMELGKGESEFLYTLVKFELGCFLIFSARTGDVFYSLSSNNFFNKFRDSLCSQCFCVERFRVEHLKKKMTDKKRKTNTKNNIDPEKLRLEYVFITDFKIIIQSLNFKEITHGETLILVLLTSFVDRRSVLFLITHPSLICKIVYHSCQNTDSFPTRLTTKHDGLLICLDNYSKCYNSKIQNDGEETTQRKCFSLLSWNRIQQCYVPLEWDRYDNETYRKLTIDSSLPIRASRRKKLAWELPFPNFDSLFFEPKDTVKGNFEYLIFQTNGNFEFLPFQVRSMASRLFVERQNTYILKAPIPFPKLFLEDDLQIRFGLKTLQIEFKNPRCDQGIQIQNELYEEENFFPFIFPCSNKYRLFLSLQVQNKYVLHIYEFVKPQSLRFQFHPEVGSATNKKVQEQTKLFEYKKWRNVLPVVPGTLNSFDFCNPGLKFYFQSQNLQGAKSKSEQMPNHFHFSKLPPNSTSLKITRKRKKRNDIINDSYRILKIKVKKKNKMETETKYKCECSCCPTHRFSPGNESEDNDFS